MGGGDQFIHPQVSYQLLPKTLTGKAYNLRFEHLYQSDFDYGIMMDDDAILYDHASSTNLFSEMDSHLHDYFGVDFFFPLYPRHMPFNKILKEDKADENHIFIPNRNMKGTMWVVKNFRKFRETEIWTDEDFTFGEDHFTAFNAIAHGKKVYMCPNMILKEYDHKTSHFTLNHGSDESNSIDIQTRTKIADRLRHTGLTFDPVTRKYNSFQFYKRHWPDKKKLLIRIDGQPDLNTDLWDV